MRALHTHIMLLVRMLCCIIFLGGWSIGHHITSPATSAVVVPESVTGSGPVQVSYSSCGVAFIGDAAHTVSVEYVCMIVNSSILCSACYIFLYFLMHTLSYITYVYHLSIPIPPCVHIVLVYNHTLLFSYICYHFICLHYIH